MVALMPRPRPCSSQTTTQNSTLHPRAAPLPAALELPWGADSGAQGGAGARAGGVDPRVHPAVGPHLHQAGPALLHTQRPLPRRVHRGAQQAAGKTPVCCISKLQAWPPHATPAWPQDRVPAFSANKAEAIIERELGAPVGVLFKTFDRQPIAAASLGQVREAGGALGGLGSA